MLDVSTVADRLALSADGIRYSTDQEAVSYPSDGNEACFKIEESSFWFDHRNSCIAAAVRNHPPRNNEPIFDIGGGNGFVSLGLIRAGFETVLVEPGPRGASNGKLRGIQTVICATTTSAAFRRSTLEAVGLFDVIEHIEDDLRFVETIRGLLKVGGRLYATVPAYSALWSAEDDRAGHFRRYTRRSIESLLERAGFTVDYSTYIFRPLPLPILMLRALPYRLGFSEFFGSKTDASSDHRAPKGRAGGVMNSILRQEVKHIERNGRMSFGGSCLLVASAT